MKNRQLLCTFSSFSSYKDDLKDINDLYNPNITRFFVFESVKNEKDIYITYNIDTSQKFEKFNSTISIHRKKETNTLFTLNSMNRLITEDNNGVFDKNFQLDWELYRDCIILIGDISVRIINIRLLEIIN
jgi:hypothetical protein